MLWLCIVAWEKSSSDTKNQKQDRLTGLYRGFLITDFKRLTPPDLSLNSGSGYQHDLYMHGSPREYRPDINAPSVDWDDYQTYTTSEMPHIHTPNNLRPLQDFDINSHSNDLNVMLENDQNFNSDIHTPQQTPEDICKRRSKILALGGAKT